MRENEENINFHFIANAASKEDLNCLRAMTWEEGVGACVTHTWTWPAYCRLRMHGMNVTFGYELKRNAINFVHGQVARRQLSATDFRTHFIVGIRADFRPFSYGHFEIVQNMKTAGARRIYMPLFPQAGLIARDRNRRIVKNVCYVGQPENSISTGKLVLELERIGCRLITKGMSDWHDLSDVDVLLGIRSFTKKTYDNKPPTKMFNAWLSGIPFIGGGDSAYEQVGEPGLNYFKVSDMEELIDSIRVLKEDAQLYERVVEEGRIAGAHYGAEQIAESWKLFMEEQVAPAYRLWRKGSLLSRLNGERGSISFFIKERFLISPGRRRFLKRLQCGKLD